jgi:hypothetical protein
MDPAAEHRAALARLLRVTLSAKEVTLHLRADVAGSRSCGGPRIRHSPQYKMMLDTISVHGRPRQHLSVNRPLGAP